MDNNEPFVLRHKRKSDDVCQICGDRPASYSFGGLGCASCKMFFRRNEYFDMTRNRCQYDSDCEINPSNRRNCRYCRLKKCFDVGMRRELFRCSHGVREGNLSRNKMRIHPFDALKDDRTALTNEDWALCSSVVQAYDSTGIIPNICEQMENQAKFPSKIRLKIITSNSMNFIGQCHTSFVRFIKDIFDLSHFRAMNDRQALLERNVASLCSFHAVFLVRELNLNEHHEYTYGASFLYGISVSRRIIKIANRFNENSSVMKLFFAVLIFSTCYNYLEYHAGFTTRSPISDGCNTRNFFKIENCFVETMFKLMTFRYGFIEASKRFAALIHNLMELNRCLNQIRLVESHRAMMKQILIDAEQILIPR